MEQKINLEQILWDSFHKFGIPKPTHTLAEITQKAVKDAMKEAVRQGLELAAENVKLEEFNEYLEDADCIANDMGDIYCIDNNSILNTINQVE